MSDAFRNEVTVTLFGKERTMRATFRAIRDIETDLKLNWLRFAQKMAAGDIGIGEMAKIIFHGLKGYGDTRSLKTAAPDGLTVEEIGDAIIEAGMNEVSTAVIQFIQIGFHGTKPVGKPEAEAATAS